MTCWLWSDAPLCGTYFCAWCWRKEFLSFAEFFCRVGCFGGLVGWLGCLVLLFCLFVFFVDLYIYVVEKKLWLDFVVL
jgi:hypothetical protein